MDEQIVSYKEYTIAIHPQPINGDRQEVFFRVSIDKESVFTLWQRISGTESRLRDRNTVFNKLRIDGLNKIHALIDNLEYVQDGEYQFFSTKIM